MVFTNRESFVAEHDLRRGCGAADPGIKEESCPGSLWALAARVVEVSRTVLVAGGVEWGRWIDRPPACYRAPYYIGCRASGAAFRCCHSDRRRWHVDPDCASDGERRPAGN